MGILQQKWQDIISKESLEVNLKTSELSIDPRVGCSVRELFTGV